MNVACFGDSEMAGGGMTGIPQIFHAYLTAYWRGETIINFAVGGSRVVDIADHVYGYAVQSNDRFEIQVGVNDAIAYGSSASALATFSDGLKALTYWLTSDKLTARSGWTYTGVWSDTAPAYGVGKMTSAAGVTASSTFDGDVLLIGMIALAGGGRFNLTVDGVTTGPYSCVPASSVQRTFDTAAYGPMLFRLAGFGVGSHNFTITTLDAGKYICADWIGRGSNGQLCSLLSLPKANAAGWQGLWTSATTDAMNCAVRAVVAQATADGRNVQYIDINHNDDPNTNRLPNGSHPNNLGNVQWTKTKLAILP